MSFNSVDSYDETTNLRSFSYDAMWGSIGGYVGMVLGISLFQLPNVIYAGSKYLKKVASYQKLPIEEWKVSTSWEFIYSAFRILSNHCGFSREEPVEPIV